jgi:predicted GNAT family acetyltransferase
MAATTSGLPAVARCTGTSTAGNNVADDDRLVLLATSVFPEFRKQGIATELIRRVLDDVRAQGKTVTIMCPIVRTFTEHNPEYADLIDSKHPGVTKGDR